MVVQQSWHSQKFAVHELGSTEAGNKRHISQCLKTVPKGFFPAFESLNDLDPTLQGSAGQSFACFLVNGVKVKLVGEANDYVGKGIAGGEVTIVPPPNSQFAPDSASLVGNTCLYGATGGRLFVNGRAGGLTATFLIFVAAILSNAGVTPHACFCTVPFLIAVKSSWHYGLPLSLSVE